MKNAFIIFFLIIGSIILRAQNISVTSFSPLPNDLTANTAGTEVKDQNGEKAALIRIQTTQTGFSFDAGMMGVVKTVQKTGEIWVYIPKGSKHITLRHQQLGTREYTYPCAIEAARTYEMKLSTGTVQTIVSQDAGGNFLVMKVSPENASVYVDDKLQQNDSKGEYSIFLGYGEHTYRVESANCTSQSGLIVIGEDNSVVNVELESTLATLTINCPTPDAKIFLNKQFKGNDSWTGSVSSGKYLIEVMKDGHRKIIDNVEIAEKEVKVVTLQALQPIYGMLKVNVKPIGSEIKLDGKNIGVTPKIIKNVIIGEHKLVVLAPNGKSISKTIEIKENTMFSIDENIPVADNERRTAILTTTESFNKPVDMKSVDLKVKSANQYAVSKNYKKAAEQYLSAATELSSNMGDKGLSKDKNTLDQLYKNAAEMLRKTSHKDEYVFANLGVLYYYGRGVKQDLQQATYYLTKPKMLEEANACYCLGMLYYDGKGSLKKNIKKAIKYLTVAAEQNIPEAQNDLGKLYYLNAETEQDNQKAFSLLQKAANKGISESMIYLGDMYRDGTYCGQNYTIAAELYAKAVKLDNVIAFDRLAAFYYSGKGVEKDYAKAAELYQKAADKDFTHAQYALGVLYSRGHGVEKDNKKAKEWLKKVADKGYAVNMDLSNELDD